MDRTLVFAHRGASHDAPENTLAAFQEALRQNADGIEGDFRLTADGQVVCIHDEDTARTGNQRLEVQKSTLQELRELEYGGWKDDQFCGQPIPLLEDILNIVPKNCHTVMELKTGPEIVQPLADILNRYGSAWKQMLIIAFDQATVTQCKIVLPEIKTHWLTDYRYDEALGMWTPTPEQIAQIVRATGADGLGSENRPEILDESFIAQLKELGVPEFHVWTVDDPNHAGHYARLGAYAVTSNRPGTIKQFLDGK